MGEPAVRTLLFTDIEGSTALLQRVGPRYAGLLIRHRAIVRAAISAHDGVEQGTEGDSFFVTFPTPFLAVAAAAAAQRGLENEPWPNGARIRVRMGIHTGEVAQTAAGLVGLAIHHAARIAAVAHGGQIVVSEPARALVDTLPDGVTLRSLGSHELRDVGAIVLHQVHHPDLPDDFPPLRTGGGGRTNVPAPLTSMIGRDVEVAAVHELTAAHRLVTLTGAGGSGKTRLAMRACSEAMSRYPGGVWWVELARLVEGGSVTGAIAESLRLTSTSVDDIVEAVGTRPALLVLDNCEHVLDACTDVAAKLLVRVPNLTVLTTSRARLGILGEAVFRVPSLSAGEARTLFIERAKLVKGGFDGSSHASEIDQICQRVDGLPLAIELAAARVATLSPAGIARRLDDRLRLLTGGSKAAPPRHQTLHATIDWSYQLLSGEEQTVLRRLAVFRAGGSLDAISATCGPSVDEVHLLDLLSSLHDKSLVTADADTARWLLPETIRDYAEQRSLEDPDAERAHDRHAVWFETTIAQLVRTQSAGGLDVLADLAQNDAHNLVAAHGWRSQRDPVAALRFLLDLSRAHLLAPSLRWVFEEIARAGADQDMDVPSAIRPEADAGMIVAHMLQGASVGDPRAIARAALAAVDDLDDDAAAWVLTRITWYRFLAEDIPLDEPTASDICARADRAGPTLTRCACRISLCEIAPPVIGSRLVDEAVAIADARDEDLLGLLARSNIGWFEAVLGRSEDAVRAVHDFFAAWHGSARKVLPGESFAVLSLVEGEHGDPTTALRLAEDFLERVREGPHRPEEETELLAAIARLRLLTGDVDGAAENARLALDAAAGRTDFFPQVASIALSSVCRERGDLPGARRALSMPVFWGAGSTDISARLIEEAAALSLALGRPQEAASLLATADQMRTAEGLPAVPADRAALDGLRASLAGVVGRALEPDAATTLLAALATV